MTLFEHHTQPLLSSRQFGVRVARHGGVALAVLLFSLGAGTIGYRATEGMTWVDALLNAAMILTGMGPATPLRSTAGKLFASGFALYSGVIFLVVAGLLVAPFVHRLLHRLHLESGER
jgi:hypothetical protein